MTQWLSNSHYSTGRGQGWSPSSGGGREHSVQQYILGKTHPESVACLSFVNSRPDVHLFACARFEGLTIFLMIQTPRFMVQESPHSSLKYAPSKAIFSSVCHAAYAARTFGADVRPHLIHNTTVRKPPTGTELYRRFYNVIASPTSKRGLRH